MFMNRDTWYDVYMLQRVWRILANNVEYDRLHKSVEELKAERGYRIEEVFANPFEYGMIKLKIEEKEYGSVVVDEIVYPKEISVNYWVDGKKEGITITSSDLMLLFDNYQKEHNKKRARLYDVYKYEERILDSTVDAIYSDVKCTQCFQKEDAIFD